MLKRRCDDNTGSKKSLHNTNDSVVTTEPTLVGDYVIGKLIWLTMATVDFHAGGVYYSWRESTLQKNGLKNCEVGALLLKKTKDSSPASFAHMTFISIAALQVKLTISMDFLFAIHWGQIRQIPWVEDVQWTLYIVMIRIGVTSCSHQTDIRPGHVFMYLTQSLEDKTLVDWKKGRKESRLWNISDYRLDSIFLLVCCFFADPIHTFLPADQCTCGLECVPHR